VNRKCSRTATVANVRLVTSDPLLAELADVLSRGKLKKTLAALGVSSAQLFDTYARQTLIVHPAPVPRIAPDPDDDVLIGTALAAGADFAVTGDRTLLAVVEHEGVRIVSVAEALLAIAQDVSHDAP
jgi:putative PIN family toxin of toxin-antitoxin system